MGTGEHVYRPQVQHGVFGTISPRTVQTLLLRMLRKLMFDQETSRPLSVAE